MTKREFQSKKRYIVAFIIATLVFILVFFISYSLSYFEFQRVSNLQIKSTYDIFEDKLDYSIFNLGACSVDSFEKISEDLHFQGRIIDDLEKKLGKDNLEVLSRKKFYTLIELEHLEFVKMLNQNCGLDIDTILFFYSNEKEDLGRSEEVGRLLGVVHSKNSKVIIYSFDINLDSELIEKLKTLYNVEVSPTVVLDENTVLVNPKNIEDIEKYLG